MHFTHALPAMGQVFHLEQKKHLFGIFGVLPQVFQVHALFRMFGCIVFKLLLDGREWGACEFCEYVCHGEGLNR